MEGAEEERIGNSNAEEPIPTGFPPVDFASHCVFPSTPNETSLFAFLFLLLFSLTLMLVSLFFFKVLLVSRPWDSLATTPRFTHRTGVLQPRWLGSFFFSCW